MDEIPTDRVIDGVDQSGLLLPGEGKGRRDFIFHYNRDSLEAIRKDQVKLNLKLRNPGFHFYEAYNLYHDPAERFPNEIANGLWAGPGMTKMIQEHMFRVQKYPTEKYMVSIVTLTNPSIRNPRQYLCRRRQWIGKLKNKTGSRTGFLLLRVSC